MTMPVSLSMLPNVTWPTGPLSAGAPPAAGFQDLLAQTWTDTMRQSADAQRAVEGSLVGEDLAMVETFTALREADLSLKLMLQIRNKLVDAYQEIQHLRF